MTTPPSPGPVDAPLPPAAEGAQPRLRPLSGRRVVASGLAAGLAGLAIALFLRTIVANTPTRISERTLFWGTVLVSGFGVVAGMAVEAVRQLQQNNPDPEYRRGQRARRRTGQGGRPG